MSYYYLFILQQTGTLLYKSIDFDIVIEIGPVSGSSLRNMNLWHADVAASEDTDAATIKSAALHLRNSSLT